MLHRNILNVSGNLPGIKREWYVCMNVCMIAGIIPIEGHIPTLGDPKFSQFLTVGPMTRRAEDLPLLMNIMAGPNRHKLRLDEPVDLSKLRVRQP
jgi:Asp-tRNA(Asn)/Glu-tRNA(Gln) amidotransferase A subunit family amidase